MMKKTLTASALALILSTPAAFAAPADITIDVVTGSGTNAPGTNVTLPQGNNPTSNGAASGNMPGTAGSGGNTSMDRDQDHHPDADEEDRDHEMEDEMEQEHEMENEMEQEHEMQQDGGPGGDMEHDDDRMGGTNG